MLRLVRTSGARSGVRFNSTASKAQEAASKASASLGVWAQRGSKAVSSVVYWSKVGLELGKYIWVKEGLSPPTTAQFQKVFTQDLKSALAKLKDASKAPQKTMDQVSGISRESWIKGGAAVVQLLGVYSLGEIIGRRHVYGYKNYSAHH